MAIIDIECAECGASLKVDEALLGSTMTCPDCKMPTFVERAGAYDLADEPRRRPGRSSSSSSSSSPRPEPPETEEQRRIRERMERWAGDC
ncbi:hypothetical protein [Tautonia sociabilis]|uniref:Uncharacterized protein n=1 Tax=Tautonia sociabilis TaxID=2080755 RepID=A0A432MMJ6_9BACT|nr:hypothetical protein [Tautonia sociabilis]RUL88642.1 hypothetical protein TsocGM_05755 [Tautonia sociabilis]